MVLTNYTAFKESLKVCAAGTRESGKVKQWHRRYWVVGMEKGSFFLTVKKESEIPCYDLNNDHNVPAIFYTVIA